MLKTCQNLYHFQYQPSINISPLPFDPWADIEVSGWYGMLNRLFYALFSIYSWLRSHYRLKLVDPYVSICLLVLLTLRHVLLSSKQPLNLWRFGPKHQLNGVGETHSLYTINSLITVYKGIYTFIHVYDHVRKQEKQSTSVENTRRLCTGKLKLKRWLIYFNCSI